MACAFASPCQSSKVDNYYLTFEFPARLGILVAVSDSAVTVLGPESRNLEALGLAGRSQTGRTSAPVRISAIGLLKPHTRGSDSGPGPAYPLAMMAENR
eukprot:436221-Hanusia_phi.AAC.1